MYNGGMLLEQAHAGTRQNYDRLSRWYDSFSSAERSLSRAGLALLELQSGETILEIGFGTGHSLIEIGHTVGTGGRVDGIDLSPGMLAVARRRVKHSGMLDRINLQIGDATSLPYSAAHCQVVFMSFTLELFESAEIPGVLAECRRVLVSDGRLGVVSLVKNDNRMVQVYEWFHDRYPAVVDCRPLRVHQMLKTAGFEIVRSLEKSLWGLPVAAVVARLG